MTNDTDDKRRFLIFAALRISGLLLFLAGVFIAFTDLVRPGGWPLVGAVMAIAGAIEAVLAPWIVNRAVKR